MANAKTPVLNLVLEGDADAQGYRILNLDLSGLSAGAPFFDDTALIRAAGDATKLARFSISGNTTGTQRVFTLPNYNGQLATLAGVEDLTNKTLNALTFGGTGGFTLTDSIVSLTGEFVALGPVTLGADLILNTTAPTELTLPVTGTVATTTQLPVISDVAYNEATWNGNLDGATKNAIRDKFESLVVGVYAPPFDDTIAIVRNETDKTKFLKFNLAGLTTATTRTLTVPNKSGTIALVDDLGGGLADILFSSDAPGRLFYVGGNIAFYGPFTLVGGFDTIFNVTAETELTFPVEGTVATLAGAEMFTNKEIVGGFAKSLGALSIRSSGSAFDRYILTADVMTSDRQLTLALGNADRTLTLANDFLTAGNFALTLTQTGTTNVTLPTTGLLASKVAVPASSTAAGVIGQWAADATGEFLYVVCDPNKWGRVALDFLY